MSQDILHIIWDWNGTILDDSWLCQEITARQVTQLGAPTPTRAQMQKYYQHPIRDYYKKLEVPLSDTEFSRLSEEFYQEYTRRHGECSLRDEIQLAFEYFARNNISQSVLSALEHQTLLHQLNFYKVEHYFENVSGIADFEGGSKIENGKKLRENIRCKDSQVLFIGDTLHDVETASALEVDVVLISSGYQCPHMLEASGRTVYQTPQQLIDHLF